MHAEGQEETRRLGREIDQKEEEVSGKKYLFQKQFTQPVIFGILLAITEAEKEI